ncbi:MAG TPA: lysophospholipid acyltransferase family protein [Propioniciclava sp.]|uniref:lysophospholipid acyltransferase family protein n=1 Tax=Propioniciclava sp. TaxID=2038686 RepID=UPI002C2AACFF|nr:lysophospholipid acyltransferase family protein [Propioniciclava sp.]HRL50104.1 lysophospholipid acyltransferase family protein [Propioniciclava sp.]HRL79571.1 lysophospholipid acyltransferase family protein [Propioniciclava sp.]
MSSLTRPGRSAEPLRTPTPPGEAAAYRRLARFVGAMLRAISNEEWDDASSLPVTGGALVVSNHVSYLDVPVVGRYLIWSGRWPRYMGKAELWRIPGLGRLARLCRQIPVERGTDRAKDALVPALAALAAGEVVAIYPEGGRTHDPDLWPQRGRTGVARMALATQVPVIPVAHWGTHEIMPGRKLRFPRLRPKRTIAVVSGPAVDLSDLYDRRDEPDVLRVATDRIMAAVTGLVETLRGEQAPADVWDNKLGARVPRAF